MSSAKSTPKQLAPNHLYYGDNLDILGGSIASESVDLVYLDPPFNSNASYNVLFHAPGGESSPAQIEAFDDTWHWSPTAERAFDEVIQSGNSDVSEMLRAMRSFLKDNDMMAYLAMMAVRLLELHRVLKPTGSLYLHCDPTASHYLKILLDAVFGKRQFKTEISWRRQSAHNDAKQGRTQYGNVRDIIFFYTKSDKWNWNQQYTPYSEEYVRDFYKFSDPDGRRYRLSDITGPGGAAKGNPSYEIFGVTRYWRYSKLRMQQLINEGKVIQTRPGTVPAEKRYLDEMPGVALQNDWSDIGLPSRKENLGYGTQKPVALLERIISASSNEGDVVLDPFCGCGTTVHAAQKLNRNWIGIDVTHLAINLIKRRLIDAFPHAQFEIHGVPKDIGAAQALATQDKHQFQLWALSMVEAQPYKGGQKGADGGVDGYLYFKPDGKITEKAIVSVKGGGNVGVGMIRDLIATVDREKAKIGIFLTLEDPTTRMRTEATAAGFYESPLHGKFEKIQILTIEDLFDGKRPHIPWVDPSVFRKAKRENLEKQSTLDL
ncbi:site-specific DNA-methyltransferase [Rhodopseudomonas palustris]|uniref:site-specific DNA-methyltransferase (adenine-specific) n=1 Tax=Rhodopseudomonas palustris (strain BisB18) TaxID=316056 RepID=Q20YV9_RHOPB